MKNLYLLITIIRRADIAEYESFYLSRGIHEIYSTLCSGTAHEKTLDILGIEKTEKAMLISVVSGELLDSLMRALEYDMKIDLPNRGVAVAIALSSVGGQRALEYFGGNENTACKTEDSVMNCEYELIVAIYERGYTNLVMDAAKAAGAAGGTVIKAKGTAAGAEKFFGLSIGEEKEMLFIVSKADKKKDIMKAIMTSAGIDTKAHALTFALPVSDTAGFRFSDMVDKSEEQ